MQDTTTKRAGIAGILWAVATVAVGFSAGSPPALDSSGEEIRTYLVDHEGVFLASAAVFVLTMPLLILFISTIAARVRSAGDDVAAVAAPAITVALAITISLTAVSTVLLLPAVYEDGIGQAASGDLLQVLYAGTFLVSFGSNAAAAVLFLAVGIAGARTGLPGWLTVSAVVLGVLMLLLSAAGMATSGAALTAGLAFALSGLWVLAAGVSMARGQGAHAPVAAAAG